MISLEEAYNIVMGTEVKLQTEKVPFTNVLNRVLAENIFADDDYPGFSRSAMDGYACHIADINKELKVIEIIPAGKIPEKKIGNGEASQIMTGAMLPEGAECVLMVEDIEKTGKNTIRYLKEKTKANIRYQGEDLKKGDLVLKTGELIMPSHIGVMATVGATNCLVYRKPSIGIISTGDEIVEPDQKPEISQIRNSNAYQLIAQVQKTGAEPIYLGKADDNEESTYNLINKGFLECDMLLLTGGVSMGEFDFVPNILLKAGFSILFQKIAVQPGKPTTFGIKNDKIIFGLPGNPVSSFIQFELLVKPLIYKMMGHQFNPLQIRLPMKEEYQRKKTERMSWFPVRINNEGKLIPMNYHGSAHIFALSQAHGLSYIEAGKEIIHKDELVDVRLI